MLLRRFRKSCFDVTSVPVGTPSSEGVLRSRWYTLTPSSRIFLSSFARFKACPAALRMVATSWVGASSINSRVTWVKSLYRILMPTPLAV